MVRARASEPTINHQTFLNSTRLLSKVGYEVILAVISASNTSVLVVFHPDSYQYDGRGSSIGIIKSISARSGKGNKK